MKQDMKEFMAKVSEDEGLRVKLEALAGLPEDEVAARMAAIACEAGFEVDLYRFFGHKITRFLFENPVVFPISSEGAIP